MRAEMEAYVQAILSDLMERLADEWAVTASGRITYAPDGVTLTITLDEVEMPPEPQHRVTGTGRVWFDAGRGEREDRP